MKRDIGGTDKRKRLAAKGRKLYGVLLLVCFMSVVSGCKWFTVVKIDEAGNPSAHSGAAAAETGALDADNYVGTIWNDKVIPYMTDKAADIVAVLKDMKANPDAAAEKYGARQGNFIVKGQGKALSVNRESRAGTMDVDLPPFDGRTDVKIQIGPVIKGTSIRDSLEFIKFDDFKNQVEFAQLSNSINQKVNDDVVNKLDFDTVQNKTIQFMGAFTADSSGEILITPVQLQIAQGGNS